MTVGFFKFKESNLTAFQALDYSSSSHSFNKAVIASYNNVKKYSFQATEDYVRVDQSRRTVFFILNNSMDPSNLRSDKQSIFMCESPIFPKKTKEVCYSLPELFDPVTPEVSRGIRFKDRKEVEIVDYRKDERLDLLYNGWKQTKEANKNTFLISFNPARYYRSYELADFGFPIYQKLVLIKKQPYAVINFALQKEYAYELSFLSLFKDPELKLINDQNDCIIINCLYDLYKNHGIQFVNLGTSAGIKGLAFFKKKLPNFENYVYTK